MHVAFLYNKAAEDPAGAADDDIPERSPVVAALQRLGYSVTPIACTLDLAAVRRALEQIEPQVVFNRVESLGGSDSLIAAVTLLLDAMRLPYTGCPTEALVATASKLAVKQRLAAAGLPTPDWIVGNCPARTAGRSAKQAAPFRQAATPHSHFILKSVYEHASFEMDDNSVVGPASDDEEIAELIDKRSSETGRPFFAERFIAGREFNLSLVGDEPQVLPPAEIDFSAFPEGKPHIVGHRAKWNQNAFEYHHTPRRFDFGPADGPLLRRLADLAAQAWHLFGLRGFARIDLRCDAAGEPWILEINANPCLAPASGFAAALEEAGIGYDGGIRQIVDSAAPRPLQRARRTVRAT